MAGALLHITTSPRGAHSHSRRFGEKLATALCEARGLDRVLRDLAADPPPFPDAAFAEAMMKPEAERDQADRAALALSERLIEELQGAAVVVLDAPMHNFTVPATLKTWIDQVVRPERTFRNTPAGKVGMLADRPAFAILAAGGQVSETGGQRDFLTPYLTYVFATLGVRSFRALTLDAMRRGEAEIEKKGAAALRWIADVAPPHPSSR
jgi:FMN-dependent NADH-azoreductase